MTRGGVDRHRRSTIQPLWRGGLAAAVLWLCAVPGSARGDSIVTFSEIMYNPAGDAQALEWVELFNALSYDMDISGWQLDGGIEYTFPAGTTIASEHYLVVAKSPTALAASAGITNVFGPFSGQLANGGETVRLENNSGRDMDAITYGDSGAWPVAPDGSGLSLAKCAPFTASAPAASWRASPGIGGTPGAVNFPGADGPVITTLIDRDAHWSYEDNGTDLGTTWRDATYNDTAWSNAPAAFNSELNGGGAGYLVTDGLVQRHRANDITGLSDNDIVTTWPDTALGDGTAQDAGATGNPRYRENIVNGKAVVRFDGYNDQLLPSSTPGIGPKDGFVYAIVVKADRAPDPGGVADGSGDYIFDRDSSAVDSPLVSLKAHGAFFGYQSRYDDGSGLGGPVSTTPISQSNFQIVMLRRNRTAGRFEIWVDGTLEGTTSDNGRDLTPQPISIGRHSTQIDNAFDGDIAEVLIYKRELTDNELQAVGSFLAAEYAIDTAFTGTVGATPLAADTPTCYFRRTFVFEGDPSATQLAVTSWLADGAVFYLNGVEAARQNMPPGTVGFATSALTDRADPLVPLATTLSSAQLVAGTNVLAVELHRAAGGTNLSFAAELQSTETPLDPLADPVLAFSEIEGVTNASWWVELVNLGSDPVNPAGYVVALPGMPPHEYVITNQLLAAGAFLLLSEAELGFDAMDEDAVVLYRPGKGAVADARVAKGSLRGRHEDRWLRPNAPTPGSANTFTFFEDVVINEIMYHHQVTNDGVTVSDSSEEWIELYNRGTGSVDLTGWKLDDGVRFDFTTGTLLASGAYLLVTNLSGRLSDREEGVTLRDAAGNPADEVYYVDGGRWPSAADGGGSSLELRDPFADNGVPETWAASDETSHSAWRSYTYRTTAQASSVGPDNQWKEFVLGLLDAGEILLDDLSVIEDPDGAAVQFISTRDFEGGIGDWRVIGNHRHSTVVPDPDDAGNQVLRLVASGPTEHMHNHAEITLADGQSVVNGTVYEISFRARWISGCRLLNTRLYFNRAPKTFVLDVPMANGTPGTVNSTAVANLGPTYVQMQHTPVVPEASDPVAVSIMADDPDGVAVARTWYTVNGGTWQQIGMVDDGSGRYTGLIPAQSAASIVQFYVEAEDTRGALSTFPAGGRDGRALYEVDNGEASDTLHNLRIVMTAAEADFMDTDINLMSNERLGCTVIFDERDVYYDVGVRYKSSERGRVSDLRIGFKLAFNADQPFLGVHDSVAIDRSAGQVVGQREMLINQVMNRGGGALSKYTDLIKVIAPKNEHTSAAELQLARFGDVYLDGQFDSGRDGNLFEYELIYYPTTANGEGYKRPSPDSVVGTEINDKGDDKENYRWPFLIKNGRVRDDYSRFIAFAKIFGLTGSAFNDQVGTVADVDQWLRYMAYAVADGHGDSYPSGSNRHNAMFYIRPSDGRVLFFPHDMDFSYSTTRALVPNTDLAKLISTVERERLYYGHVWDILTTVYNTTYMRTWTDRFGALLPEQDFAGYFNFISTRHDYLVNQISARVAPAYPFAVTTGGSSIRSALIRVEGNAWLDVKDIYLDGQDAPLTPSWTASGSGTTKTYSWETVVPLDPGPNALTFLAYDFQGQLVGSNTILVTSLLTGRPLEDNLRITELMHAPVGGSAYEFIELRNTGATSLDLTGVHFTSGITFDFTAAGFTTLAAGATCVLVSDPVAFGTRYDTNSITVAGTFTGKLSNEGETVEILGPYNESIIRFSYQDGRGWPLAATGPGHALVPLDSAIAGQHDGSLYHGGNWRAGTWIHGSPGYADPLPPDGAVLNEIVAHTDFSSPTYPGYDSNDRIELFNRASLAIELEDYYLSDDYDNLAKWPMPTTSIAPHSWTSFDEISGFHNPLTNGFGLDKAGEQLLLSHLPADGAQRVVDAVRFKGQENEVALGRYGDGEPSWYALRPTTDDANAMPDLRPVISEFMYHPPDGPTNNARDEYIEIHNPTAAAIDLWNTAGTWRVTGGADYDFAEGTTLAPGAHVVLVTFDPTNTILRDGFLAAYALTNGQATLMGPYSGQLDNRGERIALERPQAPDLPGEPVSWVIVDEVIYFHLAPWPDGTDGTGRSLQRKHTRWSGNDPDNWYAAFTPTPGRAHAVYGPADVPDWWLAAANPAWTNDFEAAVLGDQDMDTLATWEEYVTGTDPMLADSTFVLGIDANTHTTRVHFTTRAAGPGYNGRTRLYSLKVATTLTPPAFSPVPGFTNIAGDGTEHIHTVPADSNAPAYFRLETMLQDQP